MSGVLHAHTVCAGEELHGEFLLGHLYQVYGLQPFKLIPKGVRWHSGIRWQSCICQLPGVLFDLVVATTQSEVVGAPSGTLRKLR